MARALAQPNAIQTLTVRCTREQVRAALLMGVRVLQKWIAAFNESGVDGQIVRKRSGRRRKLGDEQAEALERLLEGVEL